MITLRNFGIYQIKNLITDKIYIGSVVDLYTRWANHRKDLKYNKHHSKILQHSYNKHGLLMFDFSVLLYCDKKD